REQPSWRLKARLPSPCEVAGAGPPPRPPGAGDDRGAGRWKARAVAARFFRNPNQESFDAFMVTCFPLYSPAPRDPDVRARVRFRPEVNLHFFGGELKTFDWFDDLNRIRCRR